MILTGVHDTCEDHFYANYFVQQITLYLKTDIKNYSHKVSLKIPSLTKNNHNAKNRLTKVSG
jgi:hypothetical protein